MQPKQLSRGIAIEAAPNPTTYDFVMVTPPCF